MSEHPRESRTKTESRTPVFTSRAYQVATLGQSVGARERRGGETNWLVLLFSSINLKVKNELS